MIRYGLLYVGLPLAVISAPVFLFVLGVGLMQIRQDYGLFALLGSCLCIVVMGLGFAALLDSRERQQNRQPPVQRDWPEHH